MTRGGTVFQSVPSLSSVCLVSTAVVAAVAAEAAAEAGRGSCCRPSPSVAGVVVTFLSSAASDMRGLVVDAAAALGAQPIAD